MLRRRPLLCFFLLTFAVSWNVFAAGIVQSAGVRSLADLHLVEGWLDPDAFFPYLLAGSFGPFAAALVMPYATGASIQDLAESFPDLSLYDIHSTIA